MSPVREDRLMWGIISLILLFFSIRAYAVDRAPAIDPIQPNRKNRIACGTAMTQLDYAASFRWKSPEGEDHPLRILLGKAKSSGQTGSVVAQIVHESSGECRAICQLAGHSRPDRLHAGMPEALELTCRAPVLGAMETPVVLMGDRIRFGTWLKGYRDARLRVEFDEHSAPTQKAAALSRR